MKLMKTLAIVISSSLILTGAAFAAANSDKSSRKGDHPPQKTAPVVSRHVKPETPIVMGRSISAHHKTKLHHVKVNPSETDEGHGDGQL